MVSIYKKVVYTSDDGRTFIWDVRCKSTDTKPTTGVPNGSELVEMDTGKVYFYDADGNQWLEF